MKFISHFKLLALGAVGFLLADPAVSFADPVTLDQYLNQVQHSNDGYSGSTLSAEADRAASVEGELPYAIQAFGNLTYTDDRRQTIVPIFEGTRTVNDVAQLGFKKLFDFGLQSQLYYSVNYNNIYGVSPALVPQTQLYTNGLTLSVTQPLWQNGFGRADESVRKATEAQDLSNAYSNAYNAKSTLADAQSRYWALSVAREVMAIEKQSADRTVVIRDFNAKRVKAHLVDEADLLTSDAQARSKQFDLKTAIDNERTAARAFNSARGIDSDVVNETLITLSPEDLQAIAVPVRDGVRDDVRAAEQTTIALNANSNAAIEKQKPSVNLVGTVSTNGLDANFLDSYHNTLTSNYPYYQLGLNFTVPLDFSAVAGVKAAYAQQIKAAELTYKRRLFDQENDWKDLVKKLQEAKERLIIAAEVEKAQKIKYDHESRRQHQGVTTTYQVFLYDLDYLTSALNRVQTQALILNLVAQMSTYRSGT